MEELIKGFGEGLESGFDKIASAYDIEADHKEEFVKAASEEFERLLVINGMDKEASLGARFMAGAGKALGGGGSFNNRLAAGLGAAAVGAGAMLGRDAIRGLAGMAVDKVSKSFGASANRAAFDTALQKAISSSEVLQNDPEKARRLATSIFSFAPTVASDANVLRNILDNAIYGDSLDLQTVRAVTELEEKLHKMS